MALAQISLLLLGLYFTLGFLFALFFVSKGVRVVDSAAHSATFGFRLLIFPGAMALWPVLLKRWLKPIPRQEHNAHRHAARAA